MKTLLVCVTAFAALIFTGAARGEQVCPQPAQSPVAAQPAVMKWHEVKYASRVATIEQQLRDKSFGAIVFGDSIVQAWPAEQLSSAFGTETLNAGVNGDTTQALLWRLENMNWASQSPAHVLILIGTNNGRNFQAPQTPCDTYWGIRTIVDKVRKKFPSAKIIVTSILPRQRNGNEREDEIRKINQEIQAGASSGHYSFLDVHNSFVCADVEQCRLLRPPGYVHPTLKGYDLFTSLLRQHLAQRQP